MRYISAILFPIVCAWMAPDTLVPSRTILAARTEQPPVDPLPASCAPFGPIASTRPIDSLCGLSGSQTDTTEGKKAQDRVKNNLCAYQDGDPARITRFTFDRLQSLTPSKTALPWGSRTSIPANDAARLQLQGLYTTTNGDTIGEGSYVEFVAYILEGHFGGGESANCEETVRQNVDIHLALVTERPSTLDLTNYDSECLSVTAEISSHHRPIDWELLGRMTSTATGKKLTGAQQKLGDEDLKRPVRIRGQLLFDASHSLCTSAGHRTSGNPARRSGWEIHPVYSIDVCNATSITTCKADNEARWKPLHEFLAVPPDQD